MRCCAGRFDARWTRMSTDPAEADAEEQVLQLQKENTEAQLAASMSRHLQVRKRTAIPHLQRIRETLASHHELSNA